MPVRRKTAVLLVSWLVAMGVAVASASIFAAGVARDTRAGEPTIDLGLGAASEGTARFRVWRPGTYRLFVSTVNHDPARTGHRFDGRLDVELRRPDGTIAYADRFERATMPHVMPDDYGDTELARLDLERSLIRPWTLAVRVGRPDPRFAGVRSQVKLWRMRADPGMGGLVNYVMIIPAALFAIVALLLALPLARDGMTAPLIVSMVALLGTLVWSAL